MCEGRCSHLVRVGLGLGGKGKGSGLGSGLGVGVAVRGQGLLRGAHRQCEPSENDPPPPRFFWRALRKGHTSYSYSPCSLVRHLPPRAP